MLRPSIFIFLGKLLPLSFSLIERPRKFRLKDFSSISSEGRDSNCPHFIDLFNGVILTSSFVLESNPSAGLFKVQTNLKPRESSCFFISWDNFCSFWFLHCPQTENVGSSAVEFARRDHIASSFFNLCRSTSGLWQSFQPSHLLPSLLQSWNFARWQNEWEIRKFPARLGSSVISGSLLCWCSLPWDACQSPGALSQDACQSGPS